jgi:uncharacterized protein (TIGR03435 family)
MTRFLAVAVLSAVAASAQGPLQSRFEVASVKPASPDAQLSAMNGGPMPAGPFNQSGNDPGRIAWTNVRLARIIQVAYDFPQDRIIGPDWLGTQGYDIAASVPPATTVANFRLMLQALLAERFKLAVRRETKEVSGFALEVAKGGSKLKPANPTAAEQKPDPSRDAEAHLSPALGSLVMVDQSGFAAPRPGNSYFSRGVPFQITIAINNRNRATLLNSPVSGLAAYLGNALGSQVADRTALTRTYDIHLEFAPRPGPGTTPEIASDPGPDILDAIQSQLGLKLTPAKVPVEMLVIDHAEKIPTAN